MMPGDGGRGTGFFRNCFAPGEAAKVLKETLRKSVDGRIRSYSRRRPRHGFSCFSGSPAAGAADGELVLYWRELAPRQKIAVGLDVICQVPGEYRGPASRAYLYYGADDKTWLEPLEVTITPREQ